MNDVQNQDEFVFLNAVDDDVIACRKAAQTGAQIFVARPSDIRVSSQQPKPLGNVVHNAGSGIDAAALAGNVKPNGVNSSSASVERRNPAIA